MSNTSIHVIPGQTIFRTDPVPKFFYLSGITNAVQAVATFTEDHDYSIGEYVSFRVSQPYGMREINEQRGKVINLTSNTITVDIETTFYTPFIYPVSGDNTPPHTVPAGSGVIPLYVPEVNLFDAFDNLRPN
jgi:hypothetical protein